MNPVDHPHGGGEERTSGGRHLFLLGLFLLKATKQERIKEQVR